MNGNLSQLTLSFGGNQPETLRCFELAIEELTLGLGELVKISSIYKSEAWGFEKPTADFYNQIIVMKTNASPIEALKITQEIERKLGRKSKSISANYQDRPIDIDLLFYDSEVVSKSNLTIPHYLIEKRRFILEPLAEISPNFIHPILKKSVKELLLLCEDKNAVTRVK